MIMEHHLNASFIIGNPEPRSNHHAYAGNETGSCPVSAAECPSIWVHVSDSLGAVLNCRLCRKGNLWTKPGGLVYALAHSWAPMSLSHAPAALRRTGPDDGK